MNSEELTNKLKRLFNKEERISSSEGFPFTFEGDFNPDKDDQKLLEVLTKQSINHDVSKLLSCLSETTIFKEGANVIFYKIQDIEKVNKELEEFEGQFFPRFIIIAEDYAGDYLVLHTHAGQTHFGNLDHAAWGEVDCWSTEAISFVKLEDWLNMIIKEPEESTIPSNNITYKLSKTLA